MTWSELETQRRVAKEPTSKTEIDELRALCRRNLRDASLQGLSPDGCFSFAYDAARTLATIAIRANGYRIKKTGGAHYNTFLALRIALGADFETLAVYLDSCRQMRNDLSYDAAGIVSERDAKELVEQTERFSNRVDTWLEAHHPSLV